MNYHEIRTDDMLNGTGLRVVIFLSGCNHHCGGCHNPQTWDYSAGKEFNEKAKIELFNELNKDYICGVTFSGGDPLDEHNIYIVADLIKEIKEKFPNKSIWLYTGNTYSYQKISECEIPYNIIFSNIDVLVDGEFIKNLADENYPWAGSKNQRVIDMKKTLDTGSIILYK